jgi:hypothetical protein
MVDRKATARPTPLGGHPSGQHSDLVDGTGAISTFGDAHPWGTAAPKTTPAPIVAIAMTATAEGYWNSASDGTVTGFGDATGFG